MTRSATEHASEEQFDMHERLITYASVIFMALVRVNGDELTRAATIRVVSRLPVPSGGRALVFWTQYNSVDHRARLSGTNRYARAVDHIGERSCDGIGAWRYSPRVRLSPATFVCS